MSAPQPTVIRSGARAYLAAPLAASVATRDATPAPAAKPCHACESAAKKLADIKAWIARQWGTA